MQSQSNCDLTSCQIPEVFFHPWVGKRYASGGEFGVRVLVLGEAHYGKLEPEDDLRNWTRGVIGDQLNDGPYRQFFTKIVGLLLGQIAPDANAKARVWESIAFYNFIQEVVSETARVPPRNEAWELAQAPFWQVLAALRPEFMVVLGKTRLWNNLPDVPPEDK